MPAYRKASIREMASGAYELGSRVVEGELHRHPQSGEWMVGDTELDTWLAAYDDQEILLIATSLEDDRPMPKKTCRTCGTEFRGIECPHSREVRIRLRGR